MENLHDNQPKGLDLPEHQESDAISTAEALDGVSREFHELLSYAAPEELHQAAWDMFQTYLLANANLMLPENIYTYTLLYESIRNICREVGKIPPVAGNRFKVSYEP